MSDLVGNPEERFSRVAAHTWKVQVRRSAFKNTSYMCGWGNTFFFQKNSEIMVP